LLLGLCKTLLVLLLGVRHLLFVLLLRLSHLLLFLKLIVLLLLGRLNRGSAGNGGELLAQLHSVLLRRLLMHLNVLLNPLVGHLVPGHLGLNLGLPVDRDVCLRRVVVGDRNLLAFKEEMVLDLGLVALGIRVRLRSLDSLAGVQRILVPVMSALGICSDDP
jgi:hypothetical protein